MGKLSIFGGTGFVGGRYVELYPEKCNVIDRWASDPLDDEVLYFISTTNNYHVFDNLKKDINTNLDKLLDVLPKTKKTFNFISSWFVYGKDYDCPNHAAREYSPKNPKGFYSITKSCAEDLIISYCETFGVSYRIIRLCNVIGNDPRANSKKNALEFMIGKIIRGEPVEVYDGDNYRNYLHVDDVCRGINLAVEDGELNSIYNVGSTESTRIIDIIEYVKQKTNSKSQIIFVPTPLFHQQIQAKDFFMNCNRIRGLGFVQQYNVHQALDRIIANYKK